jgi:hypothetical protein
MIVVVVCDFRFCVCLPLKVRRLTTRQDIIAVCSRLLPPSECFAASMEYRVLSLQWGK